MSADPLYAQHLEILGSRSAQALSRVGREHLLIASGVEKFQLPLKKKAKTFVLLKLHGILKIVLNGRMKKILLFIQ